MNVAQYFDHWHNVHRDLLRAVAMLEDADLSFQPSKHYPRTVGGILRHIIIQQQGWIHYVIFRKLTAWPEEDDEDLKTIPAIRVRLEEVFGETMRLLSTIPVEDLNRVIQVPNDGVPKLGWIIWHVLEQQIHHRGELFLCLTLLGKERPMIDRPE
ncbi:MAG: hypothetical protein A2Z14_19525 [Chloroflexi bacterium RBG_16_48_8]|nr:MAG: hypothetical protein A2Z14_19525 [Chloroflexi bacterium RBG_16_48_8]